MGLAGIVGQVAGAGPTSENPFAAALAGGPSSTGDVGIDTRFGPVNIGGLFGDTGSVERRNTFIPIALAGVAIVVAFFLFRAR